VTRELVWVHDLTYVNGETVCQRPQKTATTGEEKTDHAAAR